MLAFCGFIQIFILTSHHHLYVRVTSAIGQYRTKFNKIMRPSKLQETTFNILWAAWKISAKESCSLVDPFCRWISAAVPGQFIIYGDSKVLSFFKVSSNVCPWILYEIRMTFHFLVIRIRSHLSGLNTICQSFSHSCRWLRPTCGDSASFWSRITLYSR